MKTSTKVSGKTGKNMAKEFTFGKMAPYLKATGKIIKPTVKVVWSMLMAMSMKENGSTIKLMGLESTNTWMAQDMKATGPMINKKEKVLRPGLMELFTLVNMNKVKNTVKINFQMLIFYLNLIRINFTWLK